MKTNANIFVRKIKNKNRKFFQGLSIVTLMIILSVFTYYMGGAMYVYIQLMYIPIVLAAYFFGIVGALTTAIFCGLLVGPIMPLDVYEDIMQSFGNWSVRLLMFVGVGLIFSGTLYIQRKEHFRTKAILNEITDGICGIDTQGNITFLNNKFCQILDISNPQDAIGINIKEKIVNSVNDYRNHDISKAIKYNKRLKDITCAVLNANNELISVDLSLYPVKYSDKRKDYIVTLSDNLKRLEYQRELYQLSYTDNLTKLRNRRYFDVEFEKFKDSGALLSLVLCDIDGLKFMNDSFGREVGDNLIVQTSIILESNLEGRGFVSRLDGDEFAVILNTGDTKVVDTYISNIKESFSKLYINDLKMSISCGYEIREGNMTISNVFTNAENCMYLDKNSSVNKLRVNAVDTIMKTLHEKDEYSEQHSLSVSEISLKLALFCHFPKKKIMQIKSASLLHDIGKIIVPIDILTKPGKLTSNEYKKIKEHPAIGYRLLSGMKEFENIADIVLHHHERWDGKGYPQGKKEEEIPLESRIIAIADTYNAMTTSRPYNRVKTKKEALQEIIRCAGTQFDPDLVQVMTTHFNEIIG
jgi:diguanylate cyclase (GGDEF)-like protein/putative nucleotidyltransferase with HDIG domain